jgi:hypothetical protein
MLLSNRLTKLESKLPAPSVTDPYSAALWHLSLVIAADLSRPSPATPLADVLRERANGPLRAPATPEAMAALTARLDLIPEWLHAVSGCNRSRCELNLPARADVADLFPELWPNIPTITWADIVSHAGRYLLAQATEDEHDALTLADDPLPILAQIGSRLRAERTQ